MENIVVYDEVPNDDLTYICPKCNKSSLNYRIISSKVDDPAFHWYCGYCGCEDEPHLRVIVKGL